MGAERDRVRAEATPWARWGPYLSERAWGTVREDYSAKGCAWCYLPHEHARSRAYRWSEDGLAGLCDADQRLCLALALWNGRDPILKERAFGLDNNEGNHGEDVKDYWWYLDALPSHAWLRWRYHYPQGQFPYETLVQHGRNAGQPELELLDTGIFDDDRYWIVDVTYAKAEPDDVLMRIRVTNAGPEAATLHVLPTLWFRNSWSWAPGSAKPSVAADGEAAIVARHDALGPWTLQAGFTPGGGDPELLFCENETNTERLFHVAPATAIPKDGIGDHVLFGSATVSPDRRGTKAAAWYRVDVQAGATAELRLRLHAGEPAADRTALGQSFDDVVALRSAEADEFYAELTPAGATADEAAIVRQACAGMIWCKQYYAYDVARWLDGDPGQPPPPEERRRGRNHDWRGFDACDVMSMPDAWEYPWFAAWDLAFHTVVLAHLDPAFAKAQLLLLCGSRFQRADGAVPAYEWNFADVNPPVQAWAALKVWHIDGATDDGFLERVFLRLVDNFAWWRGQEDPDADHIFAGGFLGLDNISAMNRSGLPAHATLEQADGTAWMAFFALSMLTIAAELTRRGRPFDEHVEAFLEQFAAVEEALDTRGLWDEQDGFYYDVLHTPNGTRVPLRVRSMVGVIPLLAAAAVPPAAVERAAARGRAFARRHADGEPATTPGRLIDLADDERRLLAAVSPEHLRRVLRDVLDCASFLSAHGLRSLSRRHDAEPFRLDVDGVRGEVGYVPAESRNKDFGGNSNWRGPVWMPLNYLFIDALARLGDFLGSETRVECPTGSGHAHTFAEVAADLRRRLIGLWVRDPGGRRPVYGGVRRLQDDPAWNENLLFFEYFHGDDGAGLGAMHQTGWTALVADLIIGRDVGRDPTTEP